MRSKWKVKTRRTRYWTTEPAMKATTTETRMPVMMVRALEVLMKSTTSASEASATQSLYIAAAMALPKSSKTMDTVVDVGSPRELKVSRSRTSLTITAKKITMISAKENICG